MVNLDEGTGLIGAGRNDHHRHQTTAWPSQNMDARAGHLEGVLVNLALAKGRCMTRHSEVNVRVRILPDLGRLERPAYLLGRPACR